MAGPVASARREYSFEGGDAEGGRSLLPQVRVSGRSPVNVAHPFGVIASSNAGASS